MRTYGLNTLTDAVALAESRRLILVVGARQREWNRWFHFEDGTTAFDPNSGFVMGMLAMFRYARGEAVPSFFVHDFIDSFLKLMFCGLANNTMALPPMRRMADKPWAHAWRLAELRLAVEGEERMDISQLAHLLGRKEEEVRDEIHKVYPETADEVPHAYLQSVMRILSGQE